MIRFVNLAIIIFLQFHNLNLQSIGLLLLVPVLLKTLIMILMIRRIKIKLNLILLGKYIFIPLAKIHSTIKFLFMGLCFCFVERTV